MKASLLTFKLNLVGLQRENVPHQKETITEMEMRI